MEGDSGFLELECDRTAALILAAGTGRNEWHRFGKGRCYTAGERPVGADLQIRADCSVEGLGILPDEHEPEHEWDSIWDG